MVLVALVGGGSSFMAMACGGGLMSRRGLMVSWSSHALHSQLGSDGLLGSQGLGGVEAGTDLLHQLVHRSIHDVHERLGV